MLLLWCCFIVVVFRECYYIIIIIIVVVGPRAPDPAACGGGGGGVSRPTGSALPERVAPPAGGLGAAAQPAGLRGAAVRRGDRPQQDGAGPAPGHLGAQRAVHGGALGPAHTQALYGLVEQTRKPGGPSHLLRYLTHTSTLV